MQDLQNLFLADIMDHVEQEMCVIEDEIVGQTMVDAK